MELTPRQQEIKSDFIRLRGAWSDAWQGVLELDPEFLQACLDLSMVPWRKEHLDPKVRELIAIAVDANATHLYLPGVREHVKAALRLGATAQEIMEVLELSATLGIHAMNIGVPILVEVLTEKGLRTGPAPLNEYQEKLKAEFTKVRVTGTASGTRCWNSTRNCSPRTPSSPRCPGPPSSASMP